ncbi:hypothetical protein CA265_11740 [Sphingobacteriaceae bacterium GW460-11-11-14-LB5]|nr:hypothetical protein CA265_11740 [Sphingobacteriaceae bacterium GW460-11-11-14-LB5]
MGFGKDKKLSLILRCVHSDASITTTDMALLYAIIIYYSQAEYREIFQVSRSGLMEISKISSTRTYHKSIKKLVNLGYIVYTPSYHPKFGSMVSWGRRQDLKV